MHVLWDLMGCFHPILGRGHPAGDEGLVTHSLGASVERSSFPLLKLQNNEVVSTFCRTSHSHCLWRSLSCLGVLKSRLHHTPQHTARTRHSTPTRHNILHAITPVSHATRSYINIQTHRTRTHYTHPDAMLMSYFKYNYRHIHIVPGLVRPDTGGQTEHLASGIDANG